MITLRPYQQKAMDELLAWFRANVSGNPLLDACVGSGKSVMLAWLCDHAIAQWPQTRIIMLVPSKELLEQNLEKLIEVWPDAPVGIMSAAAGKKQLGFQITIATIGTLYKHAHSVGHVDLVIVDECHAIPGGDAGMYRKFFSDLKKYCPDFRVIGATGTIYRGNGEWLTAVEDPLFHDVAARVTMDDLLAQGFLAPLTTQPTATKLDASGVKMIGGDYVISELAKKIDRPELVDSACDEIIKLAADRNKWLVYCVTVQHATHTADAIKDRGIAAEVIHGGTPKAERARLIAAFKRGEIRALVSVAVLTTGFNVPDVDCIALLRNTNSPVLYVQIMGRGMRTADGKEDCLVLDFTDTVERLGPVNKVKGRLPKKNKGEAPVKVCDECGSLNAISAKECKTCGTEFLINETDPHRHEASRAQVLDLGKPHIVEYAISDVRYTTHRKIGKPDSLKASYWSGMRKVCDEWVCLDHEGYARARAEMWWNKRRPAGGPSWVPSVEQAIAWINGGYTLTAPHTIRVNESSKYPEIVGYVWPAKELEAA